jgi:hypothetical protein
MLQVVYYLVVSRKEEQEERDYRYSFSIRKKLIIKKRKRGESLSTYLFCPDGAFPAGFWFSDSCVSPEP